MGAFTANQWILFLGWLATLVMGAAVVCMWIL
jgi:hypothetical protein